MKRLVFLLIALLVVSSYGEESAPKQRLKGGFYFDWTVGAVVRHFEAIKVKNNLSTGISSCHFEADGRYVCDNAKSVSSREESSIGYTGSGLVLSVRFGGNIKRMVAIFADVEFETTEGKATGRKKGEYGTTNHGGNILIGPGASIYPFFYKANSSLQNFYVSAIGDIGFGSGGGIGLWTTAFTLEVGHLWPVSDRLNMGVAMAGSVLSTDSFDDKLDDERGYGVWVGFKFVRK